MAAPIESRAASMHTATVSIQTINVNGKQMTLAVFRQLPVLEDIPDDACLWGKVFYEVKGQGAEWIVLESGGRLFRRYPRFRADYEAVKWVCNVKRELHYISPSRAEERAEKERELLEAQAAVAEMKAVVKREREVFESLPQLFIAV